MNNEIKSGHLMQYHESRCPHCNRLIDGYTHSKAGAIRSPKENDIIICVYCTTVSKFWRLENGDLDVIALSDVEVIFMQVKDPEFARAMLVVKKVNKDLKKQGKA